jgi:hypothetical protein
MGEVAMKKIGKILLIGVIGVQTTCMQLEYIEEPVAQEGIFSSSAMEEQNSSSSEAEILKLQISKHELEFRGVSFYDAILICNEMSRKEGLDTLYQYDKPVFTEDSLIWLPNITVLENRSGYRLPTKEEWVAAWESGEIEKQHEDVGEWLYSQPSSQYSVFELAPNFLKAVGLYREREGYPAYGVRLLKIQ